jgi:hypothetical protein
MNGTELIAAERQRQIEVEGFTLVRDRIANQDSRGDSLALAAVSYIARASVCEDWAIVLQNDECDISDPWPEGWSDSFSPIEKDHSGLRSLIIAGALLAAEIDRRLSYGELP